MKKRFIVLLSGGLDSVVNLFAACQNGQVDLAVTFDYGQRAAAKEAQAARYFCDRLHVPHKIVSIPWLKELTTTALVDTKKDLPKLKNLDDMNEASASAEKVWVPNRNAVFINIAASFGESMNCPFIVVGFNKEEAATFPDNSEAYLEAANAALSFSTLSKVKVICFTTSLDKIQMVKKAASFEIDLNKLWSCYQDGEVPCGVCESCQRTKRGREVAGL